MNYLVIRGFCYISELFITIIDFTIKQVALEFSQKIMI